jgi:hypothetical protein
VPLLKAAKEARGSLLPQARAAIIVLILSLLSLYVYSQSDYRYDSGLNLPFNEKAGGVNTQTGNLTLSAQDVSLPGRVSILNHPPQISYASAEN